MSARLPVRHNQGSLGAGKVGFRPTSSNLAEKVGRLEGAPLLGLSNRLTCPTLGAHSASLVFACVYTLRPPQVRKQVRQVRRLDSQMKTKAFFRPTFERPVGRCEGGWS